MTTDPHSDPDGVEREFEDFLKEHPDFAENMRHCREQHELLNEELQRELEIPDELEPGQLVGSYRIERKLERGGMGVVYEAVQESLGRRVAIKVLGRGLLRDTRAVTRLWSEARIASRIDHPAICAVYDVGIHDGAPYIAMRYVEGESLQKKVATSRGEGLRCVTTSTRAMLNEPAGSEEEPIGQGAPKPAAPPDRDRIQDVVHLIENCSRALHVAHEAGIIHRDVKPSNIMVTESGDPVIVDFGLAREVDQGLSGATGTGEILGTPMYMSPEQIEAQGRPIDQRTDVYSLGATLYECLTLRPPFEAPTREGLFHAILKTEPPDCRRLNPAIPKDLRVVIETALEKRLDRRYQTALDFAEDLRRVREREPIRARPPGPVIRFRRWTQRNPALATSVLAITILLVTALSVSLAFVKQVTYESSEKEAALETVKRQKAQLDKELVHSQARRLLAESRATLPSNPGLSLLLAIEAASRHANAEVNDAIFAAMDASHEHTTLLAYGDGRDIEVEFPVSQFNVDGTILLTVGRAVGEAWQARTWNVETGMLLKIVVLQDSVCAESTLPHFHDIRQFEWVGRLSPDGSLVVLGSPDCKGGDELTAWRVCEIDTGRRRFEISVPQLPGPDERLARSPSFDSGGQRLAIPDGAAVRVVDVETGAEQCSLIGHARDIRDVKFGPNGTRLVTCAEDGTVRVWDARTGDELRTIGEYGDPFACFSPNGLWLATSSSNSPVTIWDVEDWEAFERLTDTRGPCYFSSDGRGVLARDSTGLRTVFDVETGEMIGGLPRSRFACFSPDGRYVATSCLDGAEIWDSANAHKVATLLTAPRASLRESDVISLSGFSLDGKYLATATRQGTLILGRVEGFEKRERLCTSGRTPRVTADGKRLVSHEPFARLSAYDIESGVESVIYTFSEDDSRKALPIVASPDERWILFAFESPRYGLRLWDTTTGEVTEKFGPPFSLVKAAAISGDGARVLLSARDQTLIWERTRDQITALQVGRSLDSYTTRSASLSFDGLRAMTVETDGASICDTQTGEAVKTLSSVESAFGRAELRPDGRYLVVRSKAECLLWDWRSNKQTTLRVPLNGRPCFVFTPDSRRLLITGDGVWLVDVGSATVTQIASEGFLVADVTRDGSRALLEKRRSQPPVAQIYNLTSGRLEATWRLPESGVPPELVGSDRSRVLRFSSDGKTVITAAGRDIILRGSENGSVIKKLTCSGEVECIFVPPSGMQIVLAQRSANARQWPEGEVALTSG